MSKVFVAIIVLLFTPHTQVLNIKQVEKVRSVSVIVRAKQYKEDELTGKRQYGMAGCSGTYIKSNQVLTAAHCFSRPTIQIWVRGTDGKAHEALIKKLDPEKDLALLWVINVSSHPYAKLAQKTSLGEQVINVGSPFSFEFLISEGIAASRHLKIKEYKADYLITTAMINPGSSGGGAFNMNGELLGVNTMTAGSPFGWAGISLAVNADTIKRFLR